MVVVVTSVYETPYPAIESAVSEIDRIYNDLVARRLKIADRHRHLSNK